MSGVNGLATTYGRIPFRRADSTMIRSGPLAASAQDAALLYAAIAPNDPDAFYTDLYDGGMHGPPPPHLNQFSQGVSVVTAVPTTTPGEGSESSPQQQQQQVRGSLDLTGMRIGIYPEWFQDSDPLIRGRCEDAVAHLQRRGAEIVEIQIPHLRLMSIAHAMKIASEFALGWDAHFYNYPTRYKLLVVLYVLCFLCVYYVWAMGGAGCVVYWSSLFVLVFLFVFVLWCCLCLVTQIVCTVWSPADALWWVWGPQ
jgi:Asp-tRNA(Asn)/Glu-tRNA(Gln) amidotransferase A subunit family amidase